MPHQRKSRPESNPEHARRALVLLQKFRLCLALVVMLQSGFINALFGADTVVTNQLGQGVVFMHYHYDNLAGGKQEVYVTDINLTDPAVSIAFPHLTAGRKVSAHAATVPLAAVAVNGQFFDSQGSVDFLKVQGTTIYTSDAGVHDEQAVVDDGLRTTNSIRIVLRPGGINSWTNSALSNIMACGVGLVQNAVKVTNYDMADPLITDKNPRTCVARTFDNHLLLMCVDGRSSSSLGMTIPELRDDLFTRGAIQHAFNLDGGGSTDMWGRGIGVANVPSDGVERAVADAVVIAAAIPATPVTPTNLLVTAVNTNISLSWALSSGAMGYHLKRSTASNGPFVTVLTTTQTLGTNSSLSGGTTYYYVVSAFNSIGESTNSTKVNATTVPATPSNLAAVPGNGKVALSWNASPGTAGYVISRSTTSGGPYAFIAQTANNSITISNMANNVTFYFVVSATNATGASAPTPQVAATPQCVVPAAPLGLAATSAGNGIFLQWSVATNAQSYTVQRAITNGGPYAPLASSLTGTNYTDTNAANGRVYFYTVTASSSCGTSPNSSEVSAPLLFVAPHTSATNIVLQGWGGVAEKTYFIRTSTNAAAPVASWAIVGTNVFGPSGSLVFTNIVSPNAGPHFFRIQTTQP